MKRSSLAVLLSLSTACGARSELIVRSPDAGAITPFPPTCEWQLGERRPIATDVARPSATVGASSTTLGLASGHVLAAWNAAEVTSGERVSLYRLFSLRLDFEGRQLGATQNVFSMTEPNNVLGLLTVPLLARTSSGFAMLALRGNSGCSAVRMDEAGSLLGVSPSFAPGGFCDDIAALDDGSLRVFAGARPVGTSRFPILHVEEWRDIAPDNSVGPSQRGGLTVIARATFGDRTGIALVGAATGVFARRVSASGAFEGEPTQLDPLASDESVALSAMRVIDDGALAYWVGPRGFNVVRFDRRRAVRERWTLSLVSGATLLQMVSADLRDGLLYVAWTTTERRSFAQVFDRNGNERSPRFTVATSERRALAHIVATPTGALIVGTTGDLGMFEPYAAALRCAQ
ncbi:MAG: hypothetical protein U0269_12510 [Polyangiales bacterium]